MKCPFCKSEKISKVDMGYSEFFVKYRVPHKEAYFCNECNRIFYLD